MEQERRQSRRTLPRVRELKRGVLPPKGLPAPSRTLPRVRELKLAQHPPLQRGILRRTLPRVRELKLNRDIIQTAGEVSHPSQGA